MFKFDLGLQVKPTIPNDDMVDFRLRCLREECCELERALVPSLNLENTTGRADLAMALDALVDLAYFTFGTALVLGLGDVFGEAWRRVHEANLKKERVTRPEESKRSFRYDVVKPAGWTPPKLNDLVK
jgi:hypothetical protein